MSETKVVVPDGMVDAVISQIGRGLCFDPSLVRRDLQAALRWLAENPIVPTEEQVVELRRSYREGANVRDGSSMMEYMAVEWQRRMFRAAEPEAVDPIEFLFEEVLDLTQTLLLHETDKLGHIRQELEAYRRGRRDKPDVP